MDSATALTPERPMIVTKIVRKLREPSTFLLALVFYRCPNFIRRLIGRLLEYDWVHALYNFRYVQAKSLLPALSATGERVVRDLRRDGLAFCHVSELGLSAEFERLQAHFNGLLEGYASDPEAVQKANPNNDDFLIRMGGELVLKDNDIISRFLTEGQLAAISGHYLGMVPRFVARYIWRTIPLKREKRVTSQRWHRDFEDTHISKIFLYLNDVKPENGPFEFIRGSNKNGALKGKILGSVLGKDGLRTVASEEDLAPFGELIEKNHSVCSAKAGTLVFADTFGFHRGGFCKDGVRDVVVFHYATAANIHMVPYKIDKDFAAGLPRFQRMVFGA